MTATDELRRMLDERGVEHYDGTETTLWGHEPTSEYTGAYRFAADETSGGRMQVRMFNVTPAQAIEATLGPAVPPPEPPVVPYDVLIDLLRDEWGIEVMWDGLRRFWCVGLTEEGVRKRDEREATLGRGTCHAIVSDNLAESEGTGDAWADCSECGHLLFVLTDPSSEPPRYCPNCGAKVMGA